MEDIFKCTSHMVDKFENVMEAMTKLVHYDSTQSTSDVVSELSGRYWLYGPPDFRDAVMPTPCPPCPSGTCSCGLPKCCEQAPYYQTHLYAEIYRQERARQRFDNPYCH